MNIEMKNVCVICIGLILAGFTCTFISGVAYVAMIAEVNVTKPLDKRDSIWGNSIFKALRVFSEHERLFPNSKYRFQSMLFYVLGVALFLAGIVGVLFR
jgi:hypothetical protein